MAGRTHNLGSMKIDYMAGASNFTKGTKTVKGQLESFVDKSKKKFKELGKSIKKSLSFKNISLSVGGMVAGATAAMKATTNYSSTLVESARVAGMGITEYEKLRLVLLGDGMAFGQAEAAARRFAKRVGEGRLLEGGTFAKGMEEIAGKFPELTKDLMEKMSDRNTGPMQVIEALTKFAVDAKLSAEETASLFDLGLGLQGRKMGITLTNAAKEFGSLAAAQEHYGRVISMTAEEHEKNKDLGQDITDTFENVKDAVRKIMSQAAEPLSKLMKKFNDWILKLKNDPDTFKNWVESIEKILSGMKTFLDLVLKAADKLEGYGDRFVFGKNTDASELRPDQLAQTPSGRGGPNPGESIRQSTAPRITGPMGPGMASSGMMAAPVGMGAAVDFGDGTILTPRAPVASVSSSTGAGALVGALEDLRPTIEELNSSFRTGIGELLQGNASLKDALRDTASRILDGVIQRSVIDPAADHLSKGVDAFFGGLFGRARGGMARGMTLVGERGPELVDFNSPAQIYSSDKLRAAMEGKSGGAPTIVYNINSTDGPGVRAALAEATPHIIEAANNTMLEKTNRVGATRRIMQGGY